MSNQDTTNGYWNILDNNAKMHYFAPCVSANNNRSKIAWHSRKNVGIFSWNWNGNVHVQTKHCSYRLTGSLKLTGTSYAVFSLLAAGRQSDTKCKVFIFLGRNAWTIRVHLFVYWGPTAEIRFKSSKTSTNALRWRCTVKFTTWKLAYRFTSTLANPGICQQEIDRRAALIHHIA